MPRPPLWILACRDWAIGSSLRSPSSSDVAGVSPAPPPPVAFGLISPPVWRVPAAANDVFFLFGLGEATPLPTFAADVGS